MLPALRQALGGARRQVPPCMPPLWQLCRQVSMHAGEENECMQGTHHMQPALSSPIAVLPSRRMRLHGSPGSCTELPRHVLTLRGTLCGRGSAKGLQSLTFLY